MKWIRGKRSTITAILIVAAIIFLFSQCLDRKKEVIADSKGRPYAGSETCKDCHKNIYDSFIHTAHYNTSAPATEESVKGRFNTDSSIYSYTYYDKVAMEKRNNLLYQVEYYKNEQKNIRRFDITIGSGTRGQSFLYWNNYKLFQLPVSYFTAAAQWANSPGFPLHNILFNRLITTRCLECHTTFSTAVSSSIQKEDERDAQLIYGVTCERCHGPAGKHVEFQLQNPGEKKGKFIINPASFSRTQQMDMCALCHSGKRENITPPFSFTAGDTLDKFLAPPPDPPRAENLDVHVNQYGLLKKSKCYLSSTTMTCNTCHNTHAQERGNIALFSQRCMTCHKKEECHFCETNKSMDALTAANCIDCHMPVKPSTVLSVQLQGKETSSPATIRSHLIAVYPEETKRLVSFIKSK
ncbi:MAG: hypothetical protein JWM28_4364 [Chitinophagaceae bacterium]|nr:hypothetical protein [Chitinophagaceae bacterium]